MRGTKALELLAKPRIYKHHLPYDRVQKNNNRKCIYTYRNPADTIVSYYYFLKEQIPDIGVDFGQIFDGCLSVKNGFWE